MRALAVSTPLVPHLRLQLGGAAALAISGTACELVTDPDADDRVVGSGVITETRDVSKFHGVDVTGVAEIVLEQTGEESLTEERAFPG